MRVDTDAGRRILTDAGARVDDATRMVRFPPALVEQSLELAPKRFSLGGRDPGFEFPLNAGQATLLNGGGGEHVVDRRTGEVRLATQGRLDRDHAPDRRAARDRRRLGRHRRLVREHTSAATAVRETAAVARLFSRHQNTSFDVPDLVPWWLETLAIVHGGRDEVARRHPVSFLFTPVSPLIVEGASFDTWLAMRGWDIPVMVMPMPLMGATSPGSRLGTILSTNCELLGMLCLVAGGRAGHALRLRADHRLDRPAQRPLRRRRGAHLAELRRHRDGTPLRPAGLQPRLQLRRLGPRRPGRLREGLRHAAGRRSRGPTSSSDRASSAAASRSASSSSSSTSRSGACAGRRTTASPSAPTAGSTTSLASVGPGGHFLGERSTRSGMRGDEWFVPRLGTQDAREIWEAAGRPDVVDEARQNVADILATHEAPPLGRRRRARTRGAGAPRRRSVDAAAAKPDTRADERCDRPERDDGQVSRPRRANRYSGMTVDHRTRHRVPPAGDRSSAARRAASAARRRPSPRRPAPRSSPDWSWPLRGPARRPRRRAGRRHDRSRRPRQPTTLAELQKASARPAQADAPARDEDARHRRRLQRRPRPPRRDQRELDRRSPATGPLSERARRAVEARRRPARGDVQARRATRGSTSWSTPTASATRAASTRSSSC